MTPCPIRRRYGYGAARVCLRIEPYRREPARPLFDELRLLREQHRAEGRRPLRTAASLALGLLLAMSFVALLARAPEESQLLIVPLQTAAVLAEPEPEPMVEPEPEPPPPPPEPIEVARAEPPPPPPPKKRPEPVIGPPPALPEPEPAPPPEPPRTERPKPRLRPTLAPPVAIDPLLRDPEPVERSERAPREPIQVAAFVPARPPVSIDPVRSKQPTAPPPPVPSRTRQPQARPARRTGPRRPRLDLPAAAAPDVQESSDTPPRASRLTPPARRSRTPSRPTPSQKLAVPALATKSPPTRPSAPATRVARQAAPERSNARSQPEQPLGGVPLGSLDSCMSDRQEDVLKRKVLAAVTTQEECVSGAGRYQFVETKNLNAFLMWIERAAGRAKADRCTELAFALACLKRR